MNIACFRDNPLRFLPTNLLNALLITVFRVGEYTGIDDKRCEHSEGIKSTAVSVPLLLEIQKVILHHVFFPSYFQFKSRIARVDIHPRNVQDDNITVATAADSQGSNT